jgi:hypothetical protein
MVDRFMGNQIAGYFIPRYAWMHARSAIETGLALLKATGSLREDSVDLDRGRLPHRGGVRRHRWLGGWLARAHRDRREHQCRSSPRVDRRGG